MRRKEIKADAPDASAPTGWAEALDRGIADVDQGRVIPIIDVINDLDATLAEMAKDPNDQVGHGDDIPNRATTNRRPKISLQTQKSPGGDPKSSTGIDRRGRGDQ